MSDEINQREPSIEGLSQTRQRIDIQVGEFVQQDKSVYRITNVLDFESIIAVEVESGRSVPLRIDQLSPVSKTDNVETDINDIADKDWKIAEQRYDAIKPLGNLPFLTRAEVEQRAKEVNANTATLYRWLNKYNAIGSISALIPKRCGWREGKSRISKPTEQVIEEVINDYYLTPQRPTQQKVVIEVLRRCQQRSIKPPHPSTVRARIRKVSEKLRLRGRGFKEKAKNKFFPAPGKFPNADFPLAVIQIDHTPADIMLVDDIYRKSIGRPYLTLALDVYSRMLIGYYLSFDPPSETSVAMCVAHAILPKEEWLLLHKVDTEWPVWGFPKTIHVDNGADFRSDNFKQSCLMHGINLEFRPVKQPRYGGHIERVIGTILREIHELPGTTFSSVKDREGYDSEKEAVMTKSEFESWLVTLICKKYNQQLHSGIGMTPSRKWDIGVFGNSEVQGVGIPPRPADRHSVLLDFLPSFSRTVQQNGITIDGITYYADVLRQWISALDPKMPGKKREFVFRRDPRDISTVWFFDPDLKQYFKVPFADQALPSMSIWEYQQARGALKREGAKSVNEHQILHAITELRSQVDESKEKSKKARRSSQRRKEHGKKISPAAPLANNSMQTPTAQQTPFDGFIDGDIKPFGEIE